MEEDNKTVEIPKGVQKGSKVITGVFVALVILAIILVVFLGGKKVDSTSEETPSSQATQTTSSETEKAISLDELSTHSTDDNCWIAIGEGAYDVTGFVTKHPGGDKILSGCGKDATEIFNARPGTGLPHSETAKNMLSQFKIGNLAK